MNRLFMLLPLGLALCTQPALAAVMTFDALAVDADVVVDAGQVYTEAGFQLTNAGNFPFGTYGNQAQGFTGSTSLFNDNDAGVTVLNSPNGDLFHLFSIDLAELIVGDPGPYAVSFVGTRIGGGTVTQTFVLDGLAGAETFQFDTAFSWLTRVRWSNDAPYHQFDNIDLEVPAPGAFLLLLAGLPGVWRLGRRG